MKRSKSFDKEQLLKLDWQYTITNKSTLCYHVGDIVFLKSNPEVPLEVFEIDTEIVYCVDNNGEIYEFIPEIILHYKDRCLMTYKDNFNFCFN